jgi:hypothetical protein
MDKDDHVVLMVILKSSSNTELMAVSDHVPFEAHPAAIEN